ncbi:hypothetical protein BAUCODRAFT_51868, partial [Baudoinia panamericana UAMH 10762]
YTNTHRAFLQVLLSRQCLTYAEAKPLISTIETASNPARPTLPEDVSQEDFTNYIDALNTAISPFDLEIRSTRHQVTRERVWALVNTSSDALTQMSTTFSAEEMGFVKRVLDAMFDTNNTREKEVMAVSSTQALRLCKPGAANADERRRDSGNDEVMQAMAKDNGVTMSQAERVLELLVEQGWFELSGRGYYSLSPRTLMELRGWLVDTYNEPADENDDEDDDDEGERQLIKFCAACREIVTVGQRCPDLDCNARAHDHCVRNLFRAQGGREQCPVCKVAWRDALPVGESAAKCGRRTTNGSR